MHQAPKSALTEAWLFCLGLPKRRTAFESNGKTQIRTPYQAKMWRNPRIFGFCLYQIGQTTGTDPHIRSKLILWNVNGIGDNLGDTDMQNVLNENNIVVLIETMKRDDYQVDISNKICYHFARARQNNESKRASGGTPIAFDETLKSHVNIVKQTDIVVWLCIERDILKVRKDLYIGFVYIPPEGSPYSDIEHFQEITNDIEVYISKGDVITSGDFNARTSNVDDYVTVDSGFDFLNDFIESDPNRMIRQNPDGCLNNFGRRLIDLCKTTRLQIMNGRIIRAEKYTCQRPNGASVIDYVICDRHAKRQISYFEVADTCTISDHCALKFGIKRIYGMNKRLPNDNHKTYLANYVWDHKKRQKYCKSLYCTVNSYVFENFVSIINTTGHGVDVLTDAFYDMILPCIKVDFKKRSNPGHTRFPRNRWFDDACLQARKSLATLTGKDSKYVQRAWDILGKYETI